MTPPRKPPATAATPAELERAWLVREGLAAPAPGGEYVLTDDGLRFMVWAIWQELGRPAMPSSALNEEATT